MEQETGSFEDLCMDEAVCFIADRHHVTPRQLLRNFLSEEMAPRVEGPVRTVISLEPNEREILKGLVEAMHDERG